MDGYTTPWPKLVGKMYAKYFQFESTNRKENTRAFPTAMSIDPIRIIGMSLPYRDMTTPAITAPIGVANDGMTRRAPAFEADSSRTTWKNSGTMNKNCAKLVTIDQAEGCMFIRRKLRIRHRHWIFASRQAIGPSASEAESLESQTSFLRPPQTQQRVSSSQLKNQ